MIQFIVDKVLATIKFGLSHVDSEDLVIQTCANTFDWSEIVAARRLIFDTYPENRGNENNALDLGAPERRATKENHLKDLVKKLNDLDRENAEAVMATPWSFKYPEFLSEGERIARVLGDEKDKAIAEKFNELEKKIVDSNKAVVEIVQRLLEHKEAGAGAANAAAAESFAGVTARGIEQHGGQARNEPQRRTGQVQGRGRGGSPYLQVPHQEISQSQKRGRNEEARGG